jgi:hypothetical protein
MGKASFWSTYQCDRCAKLDHAVSGPQMPRGWRTDEYTGETVCVECQEKADAERRRG